MEVIGIVGWKNSSKTTLIARLIPALRARGLSVSTIKHVHHEVDLDQPGKDTFAHRQAGAVDVVLFSNARWAIMHERHDKAQAKPDLDELIGNMTEVDLVLVEGSKNLPMRRIEIRGGEDRGAMRDHGVQGVLALVSDGPADADMPTFRRDQIDELADFVKNTMIAGVAIAAQM